MGDSISKKEKEKKKLKKKEQKGQKREYKKDHNNKGKSFEDMIIYVDFNGNFTSTPPHLQNRPDDSTKKTFGKRTDSVKDNAVYFGKVSVYTEKGYGFITEDVTNDSVFFHNNQLSEAVKKNDKVSFNKEIKDKGFRALNIKREY